MSSPQNVWFRSYFSAEILHKNRLYHQRLPLTFRHPAPICFQSCVRYSSPTTIISGQIIFHLAYHVPRNTCACKCSLDVLSTCIYGILPSTRSIRLNWGGDRQKEGDTLDVLVQVPWGHSGRGEAKQPENRWELPKTNNHELS